MDPAPLLAAEFDRSSAHIGSSAASASRELPEGLRPTHTVTSQRRFGSLLATETPTVAPQAAVVSSRTTSRATVRSQQRVESRQATVSATVNSQRFAERTGRGTRRID